MVEEDEDEAEVVRVGFQARNSKLRANKRLRRLFTRNQRCCLFEVSFYTTILIFILSLRSKIDIFQGDSVVLISPQAPS